jgi:sRNA-binding regulator protein Hfq
MRKLLLTPVLVLIVASVSLGDTIHLKNGSVLKGKVASFADDQFIVMLDTGSGRYLSRAMVYMGDVARIEFDSSSAIDSSANVSKTSESSTRQTFTEPRVTTAIEQPKETRITETPREASPPETQPTPTPVKEPVKETVKESETTQPEKPSVSTSSAAAAPTPTVSESTDVERNPRKQLLAIKSLSVDVAAKKDWTSSGLIVKRGDHVRVTATGTITLDPASGRTCGPEGLADLPDPKKLMPDQPTGSLIGVISSDNDDFIFLGRSGEFTATRDGLLFLSVNEGHLPDNSGSFKAVVEVLGTKR